MIDLLFPLKNDIGKYTYFAQGNTQTVIRNSLTHETTGVKTSDGRKAS